MEIYLIGGSPAFRAEAKIVRLHQFTQEDIGESILDKLMD